MSHLKQFVDLEPLEEYVGREIIRGTLMQKDVEELRSLRRDLERVVVAAETAQKEASAP